MYGFCLQERTTIRGPQSSTASTSQSQSCWLDLSGFQDAVAWLDVSEVTLGGASAINVILQTSANLEDDLFFTVGSVGVTASGLSVIKALKDQASYPPYPVARWLRWQIVPASSPSTSAWDISFRIYLCANAPGKNLGGAAAASMSRRAGPSTSRSVPMHKMPGAKPSPVPLHKRPGSPGPSAPAHRPTGAAPSNALPKPSGCSCKE